MAKIVEANMWHAIARFETANPEYKVEVNWAGREVQDIMRTSVEAGTIIDVIESSGIPDRMGEGFCMNITEYVEATSLDEIITPGLVSYVKRLASDGESWYYVPSQPFVGTVFYNKAIFAEAGIEKLPATWSEFMDCCQKIVDAGYAPMTIDDAYMPLLYGRDLRPHRNRGEGSTDLHAHRPSAQNQHHPG